MYRFFASDIFEVKSPEGTYIYDILPVGAGLASISSDDCLRLLDPLSLDAQPLNIFEKVNVDVTCIQTIGDGDRCVILTAGRDGKVSLLDPRSGVKVGEVRSGKDFFTTPFTVFRSKILCYLHALE